MKDEIRIAEKLIRISPEQQAIVLAYLQGMEAQKEIDKKEKSA